jgi:hypothetical protein
MLIIWNMNVVSSELSDEILDSRRSVSLERSRAMMFEILIPFPIILASPESAGKVMIIRVLRSCAIDTRTAYAMIKLRGHFNPSRLAFIFVNFSLAGNYNTC